MVNYQLPFRDPQHRELYFSGLRLAIGEATDHRFRLTDHRDDRGSLLWGIKSRSRRRG
jgi:hypothetical protein